MSNAVAVLLQERTELANRIKAFDSAIKVS